jgi:hypothetical protein
MAFDWFAYLQLARFLQQQANAIGEEAARRTSVSRACYASFCFVRTYARDHLGFQSRDEPADHGALRARLRRGKTQVLSERLEDLRQWRNGCDYLDDLPFDLALTNNSAIDQAGDIFQALGYPAATASSAGAPPKKQPRRRS